MKKGMSLAGSAYLLIPTEEPAKGGDWGELDRSARIARLQSSMDVIGAQIRDRLRGLELEYLGGVGGWTVRSKTPTDRQALIDKLDGIPVEVAADDRFFSS